MVMRFRTMILNNNVVGQPPTAPPPISSHSSSDSNWVLAVYMSISFIIPYGLRLCCYAVERLCKTAWDSRPGRGAALPSLHRETPSPMHRATPQAPRAPRLSSTRSVEEILGTYRGGERAEECVICLDDFKVGEIYRVLPRCNHKYHQMCINNWLLRGGQCPLCRDIV